MTPPDLTPHHLRRIAARAACDPRAVISYLARRGRSTTGDRIRLALEELGLGPPTTEPAADTDVVERALKSHGAGDYLPGHEPVENADGDIVPACDLDGTA